MNPNILNLLAKLIKKYPEYDYPAFLKKLSQWIFSPLELYITDLWQLLALLGNLEEAQKLLGDAVLNKNSKMQLSHYAALSGKIQALTWIKKHKSELLTTLDSYQRTIAHYAALSDNPETLTWIQQNLPKLLHTKDKYDCTIAHYAMVSGPATLAWVQENLPELLTEKNSHNSYLLSIYSLFNTKKELNNTVKAWLSKREPYLILDDIGAETVKLLEVAKEDSDGQFKVALAQLAQKDFTTQIRILTRRVTLDGTTLLHILCKNQDQSKLELLAQYGMLHDPVDKRGVAANDYCSKEFQSIYTAIKQKYSALSEALQYFSIPEKNAYSLEEKEQALQFRQSLKSFENSPLKGEIERRIDNSLGDFNDLKEQTTILKALDALEDSKFPYPHLTNHLASYITQSLQVPEDNNVYKRIFSLFKRVVNIEDYQPSLLELLEKFLTNNKEKSIDLNNVFFVTLTQLLAIIHQQIKSLEILALNDDQTALNKIFFLQQLASQIDDNPNLALSVDSVYNQLITILPQGITKLVLVDTLPEIEVIDLADVEILELTKANRPKACADLYKKAFNIDMQIRAGLSKMSDEEKEAWLEKFAALHCAKEFIQQADISEEDYFELYGILKRLAENPRMRIKAPWQLQALLGDMKKAQNLLGNACIENERQLSHYAAIIGNLDAFIEVTKNSHDLLLKKDMNCTHAHYAAWSGNSKLLDFIKDSHPDSLNSLNDRGNTIAHYAAQSITLDSLKWIFQNKPELLDLQDKDGCNIAHYAAFSGNTNALQWINQYNPELLKKIDKHERNISFYAARSGNPETLTWLYQNKPELLQHMNTKKVTLGHYVAWSGQPEALDWVKKFFPELLQTKDSEGNTLVHYGARSGNPEILDWIKHHQPELFTDVGNTVALYAAFSGKIAALEWINKHYPKLLQKKDIHGSTLAHYAAQSGNPEVLEWVKKHYPKMLDSISTYGSIAHHAAWSGRPEALTWVHNYNPKLFDHKNGTGINLAHYAASSGYTEALDWIYQYYPEMFVADDASGRNVSHFALLSDVPAALAWVQAYKPKTIHSLQADKINNKQLQDWLNQKSPYLILDEIGQATAELLNTVPQNYDDFKKALEEFSKKDPITRTKILTRRITYDNTTVLQAVCKTGDKGKLSLFAEYGGMLIATGDPKFLNKFKDIEKHYRPLTDLFKNYLTQKDRSCLTLAMIMSAEKSLEAFKNIDCPLVKEIKQQIEIDKNSLPQNKIENYLLNITTNERQKYLDDQIALKYIFTHGTTTQKQTYCEHQKKDDLFEKAFEFNDEDQEYVLKPDYRGNGAEIIKQQCIFPYLLCHLNKLKTLKDPACSRYQTFFDELCDNDKELLRVIKSNNFGGLFQSNTQSNNPFVFIKSMRSSDLLNKVLTKLKNEFIDVCGQDNNFILEDKTFDYNL